ncbi:MAG: hypothetical protein NTW32_27410 [Chloroflexi bacterium]|nr:hypothetical protein [Chloroflexota bacterium]
MRNQRMVDIFEVTGSISLDQTVVFSKLQLDGDFVHSIEYSTDANNGTISRLQEAMISLWPTSLPVYASMMLFSR